ncbi:MAG: hypothetical protein HZC23_15250 [Rhodocyclales bacterium]|nr:hypothetical protein [Rhodocyclales bacterium]
MNVIEVAGLVLMGIGVAGVIARPLPPGGFRGLRSLLGEYQTEKDKGNVPGPDAQDANIYFVGKLISIGLFTLGGLAWLIGFLGRP